MHDTNLVERLRSGLRHEGDGLPFTITTDELERRLVLRRRARNGQRRSLLAAGFAALAVGAIFAVGSGWLRMPAVGVAADPTSSQAPPTVSPGPESPEPATASPRPALGGPRDAIVVRSIIDSSSDVQRIEVQLLPIDGDVSVIVTFSGLLGADPSPDASARLSADGFLAVPLVDWTEERPAGVAIYDLLQSNGDPQLIRDLGASGIAWGPDGRLALFDPQGVTVVEPKSGIEQMRTVIPRGISIAAGATQGEIWTRDGSGFLAWRQDGGGVGPGVLKLDGTFVPGHSRATYAPLGIERIYDAGGRQLLVGCDAVVDAGSVGCALLAEAPGGPSDLWYKTVAGDGSVADYRWDSTGEGVWLLLDKRSSDGRTLDLVLRAGGPDTYADRATLSDIEIRATTDPRLVGIAADEGRVAIALDDGLVALVDAATGEWVAVAGSFAGWADQRGTPD